MGIVYRKAKIRLNYREEKPEVYKAVQLTYPPIKEKELLTYAANAAALPESTMKQCVEAIAQAIVYFAINGMRVVIPNFGGFYLKFQTKTAQTAAECTLEKCLKKTCLAFASATELRELISQTSTSFVPDDAVYNVQS